MTQSYRVGILIPSSSIVPMGRMFLTGFKSQLIDNERVEIEIVKEFVGQSSVQVVQDAVNKLLEFEEVDAVTGIVSSKTATEVSESFSKNKKVFLVNNLGETILNPTSVPQSVIINSPLMWQQMWSLGKWATQKFGPKAMFVGGVYDMAYCFTYALDKGMNAASTEANWSFAVSHMPEEGSLSDPSVVFEFIEKEQPDFLFAAFCGEEATLFLDEFVERGLHKAIPLVSLPYLLESYNKRIPEGLIVYTTDAQNEHAEEDVPNNPWQIFETMGRDSARILMAMAEGKSLEEIKSVKFLAESNLAQVNPGFSGNGNRIYIVKNIHKGDKETVERISLEEVETIDIQSPDLQDYFKGLQASWNNPYLGV